jgi:starch phosphorylase
MKAGINGVLNLSILDGWFDEAYEVSGGWAIGDREAYAEDQDGIHASAIYYLLENEIAPLYYDRREQGLPREWIRRVKQSIMGLSPRFDCKRMIEEYASQLYDPAHSAYQRLCASGFEKAREKARWNARIREVWDRVRFVETGPAPVGPITSGKAVPVRAAVDLAGLKPDDVRVEIVMGRVGATGQLEDTEVMLLPARECNGSVAVFGSEIVPRHTGRLGYALRISPNHYDDPLTRPCSSLLKWGQ